MTEGITENTKKDKILRVVFITYMVSVVMFLVLLYDTVRSRGGLSALNLDSTDFLANCLRIIADTMIIVGIWNQRKNALLIGGFLLNIVPQVFEVFLHFRRLSDSMLSGLPLVATVFLIFFYIMLIAIIIRGTLSNEAYIFTKIAVISCVFFWLVSDVLNLAAAGVEGPFTVIFLCADFLQMATLVTWGVMLTDKLKTAEN